MLALRIAAAAALASAAAAAAAAFPSQVLLSNAADAGVYYPVSGLGTAGGGTDHGYGVYPECWASCFDPQCIEPNPAGCGANTQRALATWFTLGGRRIDSADTYRNQDAIGAAIRDAAAGGIPREQIFFQTKIGSSLPMGYGEVLNQTNWILKTTGLSVIDHLMLHWPSCETGNGCGYSTDPYCSWGTPTYDDVQCRLSSWRALLDVWRSGRARSVGVSNFNVSALQEILAANLTLPSLNQVSFHLYHSVAERELLAFCNAHGIVFNSWVPFARSDSWVQQPPCAPTPVQDPTAGAMAARYNATSAQLQLAWQVSLGIAVNPRSQSALHMAQNLDIFDLAGRISAADSDALWGAPQSICEPPACTNPVTSGCVNNGK